MSIGKVCKTELEEYLTLREKSPNTEFFLVLIFLYLECRKIWTRKNYVFGHFSRSVNMKGLILIVLLIKMKKNIIQNIHIFQIIDT